MNFVIHGPFEIPRYRDLVDTSATSKKKFWTDINMDFAGLADACGCYVFVVKAKRGALPWYVGRTTKRTFKLEALGAHQANHYNWALSQKIGVKPLLFLLAKTTPSGKFAKSSTKSHKDVEFLEHYMFGMALKRNSGLRNANGTKFLKNLVVPGIINTPPRKPTKPEREIKETFGLSKR